MDPKQPNERRDVSDAFLVAEKNKYRVSQWKIQRIIAKLNTCTPLNIFWPHTVYKIKVIYYFLSYLKIADEKWAFWNEW